MCIKQPRVKSDASAAAVDFSTPPESPNARTKTPKGEGAVAVAAEASSGPGPPPPWVTAVWLFEALRDLPSFLRMVVAWALRQMHAEQN